MPKKFRDAERVAVEQLIIHCYNIGYSVRQTQDYLRIKRGVQLNQDRIYKIRSNYVNNDGQWLIDLAMDQTAFVNLFHEKLQQLESYRRSLLDLIIPSPEAHGSAATKVSPTVHVQAISNLHKITMSIASLEKMLPMVSRFAKDMDVNDLIKFNKAWEAEFNPRGDVRSGEPAASTRPEYAHIQSMVNSALKDIDKNSNLTPYIKKQQQQEENGDPDSTTTIPRESSDPTFRAVI